MLGQVPKEGLLITQLTPAIGQPQRQLDLVSPYFGAHRGRRARPWPACAARALPCAYSPTAWRRPTWPWSMPAMPATRAPLIEEGVQLYELRRQIGKQARRTAGPGPRAPRSGIGRESESLSSAAAPAARAQAYMRKTFAVDGERIFVGSFNFDPRSAHLNTGMGLLINSPEMASQMSHTA